MNSGKKRIIKSFLDIIQTISDKEYQIRVWIRGEGPECDDFEETVNEFFDLGQPIFDNYIEYGLTTTQQTTLEKFQKQFEKFSDENDYPDLFIDSPEWDEIMKQAKEVLKAFNYQKPVNSD